MSADIVFPNIFNDEDVGESALPNAMPWDTIASARYVPYQDFSRRLPELRKQSEWTCARDGSSRQKCCSSSQNDPPNAADPPPSESRGRSWKCNK